VQFTWDAPAAANRNIVVDLGTGFASYAIDRIYIPNHDITSDLIVEDDDNAGFTSAAELLDSAMVSGTDFDSAFDTAQTQRYMRIIFASSGVWSLGQLWFSTTVTTTAGPEQGWTDELIPNVIQLPSGDSIQTDADQQAYEFRYPVAGSAAATDKTKLEALIAAVSTYRPFLLDPPYDTESSKVMKLDERARVRINTLVPASGTPTADIRLSMLEYLG